MNSMTVATTDYEVWHSLYIWPNAFYLPLLDGMDNNQFETSLMKFVMHHHPSSQDIMIYLLFKKNIYII